MLVDEHFVPDDGCEYSPSCLLCPLPVCKYDDPKKWGFQNLGIVQAKSRCLGGSKLGVLFFKVIHHGGG